MDVRGDEPAPQERWPLAFRCAIAMAGGAAIVWNTRRIVDQLPDEPTTVDVSSWSYATATITLAVVVACTVSVMALLVKQRWLRDTLTILAVAAVGCALATMSSVQTSPFDSMRERPVTVIGVVASAARMDDGGTDRLSKYAIRAAAQSFVLRVNSVLGVDIPGEIDCEILVRVSGLAPLPARGMRVCVRGWYEPPSTTMNPGSRARRAIEVSPLPAQPWLPLWMSAWWILCWFVFELQLTGRFLTQCQSGHPRRVEPWLLP